MSYSIAFRHITLSLEMQRALAAMSALMPGLSVSDYDRQLTYGPGSTGIVQFVEIGSNNLIDNFTNEPARHWTLSFIGGGFSGANFMEQMIEDSKHVESMMHRIPKMPCLAERFIAFQRKQLANALPLGAAPMGGDPDRSAIVPLRLKLDPKCFSSSEEDLRDAIDFHPFTAWIKQSGIARHVGNQAAYGTTSYTWQLDLNLRNPLQRDAIFGWLMTCTNRSRHDKLVNVGYPDSGALTPWLERIWRETATGRPASQRA